MKYIFVVAILPFLLYCCNTKDVEDKSVVIDLEKKQEIVLSDIVAQVRILPLIVKEANLFGNIRDICFLGDTVYVLDDITASISAFDVNTGRLTGQVCHRGSGPNEYINPIALASDVDNLYLLDMPTRHIIVYDRELNPVETVSLSISALDFIATGKGFFLQNIVRQETPSKVVCTDKKGAVVESYLPFPDIKDGPGDYQGGTGKRFVKTVEGKIFFTEAFSNHIFVFDHTGSALFRRLDFIHHNPPSNVVVNHIPDLLEQSYALCEHFFVCGESFIFSFLKDMERYYCFYKPSEGVRKVGRVKFENDGLPFFPRWQQGETLVGCCYYEDIKDRVNINEYTGMQLGADQLEDELNLLLFYNIAPL